MTKSTQGLEAYLYNRTALLRVLVCKIPWLRRAMHPQKGISLDARLMSASYTGRFQIPSTQLETLMTWAAYCRSDGVCSIAKNIANLKFLQHHHSAVV